MSKSRKRSDPRPGRGSLRRKKRAQRSYAARLRAALLNIGPYFRRNWTVVRACLIFAACMLVFLLIYSKLTNSSVFEDFRNFTARATAFTLNLFGGDVNVDGTMLSSPDFSMGIIAACTGIIPIVIFIAATLAYPATLRQKAIGIVLGVLGIYAVNLIRTTTLFVVGAHSPGFFDTAHYLVWQSLMILIAVLFWLLWVSRVSRLTNAAIE